MRISADTAHLGFPARMGARFRDADNSRARVGFVGQIFEDIGRLAL